MAKRGFDASGDRVWTKKLTISSSTRQTEDEDFEEFTEVPAVINQKEEDGEASGRWCRFCWASEATEANPLLGTCKCAGTVG